MGEPSMEELAKLLTPKNVGKEPTFIYKPGQAPMVVPANVVEESIRQGWYRSPMHFPGADEKATPTRPVEAKPTDEVKTEPLVVRDSWGKLERDSTGKFRRKK